MKGEPGPGSDRCCGVEIAEDGAVVVAERINGRPVASLRYPAGDAGVAALKQHLASAPARSRVCIRSCGAAAFATAMALSALPHGEVMLVARTALEAPGRSSREPGGNTPEERAQRLARLAEHLY